MTQAINNFREIADDYAMFFFDLFGVTHDGSRLYPHALEVFHNLKDSKKDVIFISNAPRRKEFAAKTLSSFGLTKDLYVDVITSGEVAHGFFKEYKKNSQFFYIGPERDAEIINEFGFERVDDITKASFILNTGLYIDNNTEQEIKLLRQAIEYQIPLFCLNPDKIIVKQTGHEFLCAGVIAEEYRKLGGEIHYFGKPFKEIYEKAIAYLPNISKNQVLCIGDSMETDILGASSFGFASCLTRCGIHQKDFLGKNHEQTILQLEKLFKIKPSYSIAELIW